MKEMRLFILVFICTLCTIVPQHASASSFDSIFHRSDLMVSGNVVRHRVEPFPDTEGKYVCRIDFCIFMMCAEPSRYDELLKITLPGDTLTSLEYFTSSVADTIVLNRWLNLPLMRDTTRKCGWRLTESDFRTGIFGDTVRTSCDHSVNYINSEYGVVEQKLTRKRSWGYNTFTALDGTIRQQSKYKQRGEKHFKVRTEYFPNGRKKYKVRYKESLDRHGVRVIAWTFRANGKPTLLRQKILIWD